MGKAPYDPQHITKQDKKKTEQITEENHTDTDSSTNGPQQDSRWLKCGRY